MTIIKIQPDDVFVIDKTPRGKVGRKLVRQFKVVVTDKDRTELEPVGPGFDVNWDGLMTRKA